MNKRMIAYRKRCKNCGQEIKPKEKFNRAKEKQKIIRLKQEYEDR